MLEIPGKFMNRFRGLMRAHGSYSISGKKDARGKLSGKARTLKEPVTIEKWRQHLAGKIGLGIVPVDDDARCWFGAIDVDIYDLRLEHLEERIQNTNLPLIPCRTKSGGAHLYLFFKDPTPASDVREILSEWAAILGYGKVEIFPKQGELGGEDDVGSWINMPYFGGKETTRYALRNGEVLSPEEFLSYADQLETTIEGARKIRLNGHDPELEEAPPCLQHLAKSGFSEGTRNTSLFNLGVYCRLRYGDDWHDKARELNRKYLVPPITEAEVNAVFRSVNRKKYFYKCKEPPISLVCNRAVCARRDYGIKQTSDPGIVMDGLVKILTDPPTWYVNVDGKRIKVMSSEDLLVQHRFVKLCVDSHNILPTIVKPGVWHGIVRELLEKVEEIAAPEDTGTHGEFMTLLEKFCTEKALANHQDELLTGRPMKEGDRILFRSSDMLEWMRKKKFSVTSREAWINLRSIKATTNTMRIKGKLVRIWSIPAFAQQTDLLEIPEIKTKDEF